LEDGLVLNGRAVLGGRFKICILLHGWWEDDRDGEVELGVVGDGRDIVEILPFVVEDGVELDSCVSVG
jgi:hypothetical protein